jgi:hypothetical protein
VTKFFVYIFHLFHVCWMSCLSQLLQYLHLNKYLVKNTHYKAPHCAVFSIIMLLPLC